jgi:hypothetical protein
MKICVVMYYDAAIKEYGDINYNINKMYCAKYNIPIFLSNTRTYANRPPAWEKLPLVLKYITQYDYVIWIDADAHFYNEAPNIADFINAHKGHNIIFSKDFGNKGINSGVFIVKNSKYCIDFLNKWAYDEHLYNNNSSRVWWEQGVLLDMVKVNMFYINDQSVAVNYGILQHFFKNEQTPESNNPFICHMAGRSYNDRVSISKKYYASITK